MSPYFDGIGGRRIEHKILSYDQFFALMKAPFFDGAFVKAIETLRQVSQGNAAAEKTLREIAALRPIVIMD